MSLTRILGISAAFRRDSASASDIGLSNAAHGRLQGRRAVRTGLAILLGRGIVAGRHLILVPVFLGSWGAELFGEWLMLSSVPNLIATANTGFGTAAAMQIGIESNRGKIERASQWYNTSIALSLLLISGICALVAVSWAIGPNLFDSLSQIGQSWTVLVVLLASLLIRMLERPGRGWWIACGKPAVNHHWFSFYTIVEIAMIAVAVVRKAEPLEVALLILLWSIVWIVINMAATIRSARKIGARFGPRFVSRKLIFPIASNGLGHQLTSVWQAGYFQGSIVLAGTWFGPSGAAAWASLRIVLRAGLQLSDTIAQAVGPEFQVAFSDRDALRLRTLWSRAQRLSLVSSLACSSILMVVGLRLFDYWTQGKFSIAFSTWAVLVLSLVPASLWAVDGQLQKYLNRPWRLNLIAILFVVVSLLVALTLQQFGLLAFAVMTLVFDSAMFLSTRQLTHAALDSSLAYYRPATTTA